VTGQVPEARFTVLTLGVADVARSRRFYVALGFERRYSATGDEVVFFDTGGTVLALYRADSLAASAGLDPPGSGGGVAAVLLAWNCADRAEVDAVLAHAADCGAAVTVPAHDTDYGGYGGVFADPDGYRWEVVVAPNIAVGPDRRVHMPA
jgi:hypothetical protein